MRSFPGWLNGYWCWGRFCWCYVVGVIVSSSCGLLICFLWCIISSADAQACACDHLLNRTENVYHVVILRICAFYLFSGIFVFPVSASSTVWSSSANVCCLCAVWKVRLVCLVICLWFSCIAEYCISYLPKYIVWYLGSCKCEIKKTGLVGCSLKVISLVIPVTVTDVLCIYVCSFCVIFCLH